MSHATADLEYFKCDVCGVYLHKDIFCDHRRECKGLHSTELKKQECKAIQAEISRDTRRRVAALQQQPPRHEEKTGGMEAEAAVATTTRATAAPPAPGTGSTCGGGGAALPLGLSVDGVEKQQDARVRRRVADAYQKQLDAEFEAKLTDPAKQKALLDFLSS